MYLILLISDDLIMKKVFLGIGSNLGNRESNLKEAVAKIEEAYWHDSEIFFCL